MTQTARKLLWLWDYGWCEYDRVTLPCCHVPQDVIREYRSSDAFGTSFVGQEPPHTSELHGPFLSSAVSESDYELITPQRFLDEIAAIRTTEGFTSPPTDEQWHAVQSLASVVANRCAWFYKLRLTEDDSDRFHDWGFVLTIFREFICASPDSEFAERLVFGYD